MAAKIPKKPVKLSKEDKALVADIKSAAEALQGTQHNPIQFLPVIRFLAPIIARIAARYAIRLINKQLAKKLKTKQIDEATAASAERVASIAAKIALRKS